MEMTRNTGDQINPGRLRLCMMEEERSAGETGKCIKRRRRDPSAFALSCNIIDQQSDQQQQPRSLGDRTVAVATTVKRSSRFRGVSRFNLIQLARIIFMVFSIYRCQCDYVSRLFD